MKLFLKLLSLPFTLITFLNINRESKVISDLSLSTTQQKWLEIFDLGSPFSPNLTIIALQKYSVIGLSRASLIPRWRSFCFSAFFRAPVFFLGILLFVVPESQSFSFSTWERKRAGVPILSHPERSLGCLHRIRCPRCPQVRRKKGAIMDSGYEMEIGNYIKLQRTKGSVQETYQPKNVTVKYRLQGWCTT